MPELIFQGHSDDTFGEYGLTGDDYDCCGSGALIVYSVEAAGEGLRVIGQYGGKDWPSWLPACWLIAIQQLDEDIPIPDWPMEFQTGDSGYSPMLIIDAPDGVKVKCLNRSATHG